MVSEDQVIFVVDQFITKGIGPLLLISAPKKINCYINLIRIERHWRDLFYGCTSMYYALFSALESDGLLALHNEKHMALLHRIFLPRLNRHLTEFRNGWNHHPLSSERNRTPLQLMLLNLPPPEWDIELDTVSLHH